MHFFDSLSCSLRGQQNPAPRLQNQYMGHFFTSHSAFPSPGEINKMKGISSHTAVRLHNPYFPQGHAVAAIDLTLQAHCRGGRGMTQALGVGRALHALCIEAHIWNHNM